MDAGINELEFATLRSLRTASASGSALADDNGVTAAPPLRMQHSNLQDPAPHSAHVETGQDGIPREVLVAPAKSASDLPLDTASHNHLQNLIKQSVENVGLKDRAWEVCSRSVSFPAFAGACLRVARLTLSSVEMIAVCRNY